MTTFTSMKKILLVPVLLFASLLSYSQFVYKIKADSVLITNDSCTAELNLENSTKHVLGFLYNKGNGRTEFRKGLIKIGTGDSLYIIGADTLNIAKGMGSVPISKLLPAIATNSINNKNYTQHWQWDSLAGVSGLKLSSSSTVAASNLQRVLEVTSSGANGTAAQTTVAGYFSNTHTAATTCTNIALEAIASGGTNNFAGRFTGHMYLNGTDPGISLFLGTFAASDYYIRRSGTGLILNSASYQTLASGLDIYRYNPTDGHTWYTGVSSTTIKAVLKQNGNFLIGNTVDGGAKLQVFGKGYFESTVSFNATNTATGTTGNQTINKPSGTVNIAASGTAVTVTNNLVTASSIVYAVVRTNDATAYIKNVVPGAGTFTINLGAAATAEVSIGFVVFN